MNPFFEDLTPDITAKTFEGLLEEYDKRDIEAVNDSRRLYSGTSKPKKPPSMSAERWKELCDEWTPAPLLKVIVKKIVNLMYGRDVERTSGDKAVDALLEPIWDYLKLFMPDSCTMAGIDGDGAIRMMPDWEHGIHLTWWDANHIVPIYDPETLRVVGMVYDALSDDMRSQIARALGGKGKVEDVKELVTRHIRDPLTGEILQPGIRARFVDGKRVPWDGGLDPDIDGINPLGDYLDCVFWRNDSGIGSIRGQSDAACIKPLLHSINERLVQNNMVIRYSAYPVITTTASFRGNPSVHAGKVFQLGADSAGNPAQMEYLEWSQNMDGAMAVLNRLVGLVHEISQVPEVAVGDLEHIGSLSSGRAYEVAMSPIIDLVRMRERLYTWQERQLMELCVAGLAHVGLLSGYTTPFGGIDNVPDMQKIKDLIGEASIEFDPVRVARDELTDAQVHSMRIASGYESEYEAIKATHPQWAEDKVLEELKRTGADQTQKVDETVRMRAESVGRKLDGESEETG